MCDTLVANKSVTRGHYPIFGKVSDRCTNEPQYLVYIPAADHAEGEKIQTVYIEVDQVKHTNALILSKPSWIWGGEMGINEYGVCCGNETVYSKEYSTEPALMGLDIVRMSLERAKTAKEALDVAIFLLEKYGQGGSCAYDEVFFYDNSFLFADRNESWVLETTRSRYAAKKVEDVYTISNCMTLSSYDIGSKDLVEHAKNSGYKVSEEFDFAEAYSNWPHKGIVSGTIRRMCTDRKLNVSRGHITIQDMIRAMQSHTSDKPFYGGNYSPCMHVTGSDGLHQSCNSMAAELMDDRLVIWGAGNSLPCCSLYKPCWFDAFSKNVVFEYDQQERGLDKWLRREKIHRSIASGKIDEKQFKLELAELQKKVYDEYEAVKDADQPERQKFCDRVDEYEDAWITKWEAFCETAENHWGSTEDFRLLWEKYNHTLGQNRKIHY